MTTDHSSRSSSTDNSGADSTKLEGVFAELIPELQRAIKKAGYAVPSPIQEQSIPHLLEGKDLIGGAQTGTGKTAAFTLPLLERLSKSGGRPKKGTPRALILAPTRELAAQIGESVEVYGKFLHIFHTVIFGGVSQGRQVKAMQRGVDILVATPGRLLDLMGQGYINLNEIEYFILDEVDRMLDMGFIHDIKKVLREIPSERQTLFFSATMAPEVESLANTMVRSPVRIAIAPDEPTVDRIAQSVLFVDGGNKNDLLAQILKSGNIGQTIVFTQMKHVANRVVAKLEGHGVKGAAIHGNKSQGARTRALEGFKDGTYKVLVATDVAARGIDVDGVTHVVNYDLPVEAETYIHRIGRTARAGAEGKAISFCSAEQRAYLRDIEKLLGKPVPVDEGHPYHSEAAKHSTEKPPARGGGGGGRGRRRSGGSGGSGGGGSKPRSGNSRNRNRRGSGGGKSTHSRPRQGNRGR
ncbi:DEAD/DEAH box helicase [Verrucomicrobiales bacterium]|nr:DEAD/DEAH box helicase [Verrucomicrobiales bacterium]